MAASRLVILGVAVAAAGGAGYVAKTKMVPPPPEVIIEQAPAAAVDVTDVLILTKDIPMGGSLRDGIGWQAWPSNGVNENFITRDNEPEALDTFKDSMARVAMYAGEPMRKSKLIGEGRSFMSSVLPSGHRAVATQISVETAAGGFILPNDHVDVIMTRRSDSAAAPNGFSTETILKNIRVLAIDQTIQQDEEGRRVKVGQTATLELTPEQAEIITVAQQLADRLTLALRPVADAQEVVTDQADHLIAGRSAEPGRPRTIRMIKQGDISEIGVRK